MSETRSTNLDERDSIEELRALSARLASRQIYFSVLDAFPGAAFILNGKRQVLYANRFALKNFGLELLSVIGNRPGDLLVCENAEEGGCGSSESCSVCGIVKAVETAMRSGQPAREEARLSIGDSAARRSVELLVTVTPIHEGENDYFIVAFEDLSDKKRREVVERIFFHDVLNSISVIKSSAELLQREPEDRDYVEFILQATANLEEEIKRQRDLKSMERGELEVKTAPCSSLDLLGDLVVDYSLTELARDRTFILDREGSISLDFETDAVLLRRVLGNMFKNALEASKPGELLRTATRAEGGEVLFEVHNSGFIPCDDQLRIFQRSFTTKGPGRGVGTYSMRLLTERYLGGRIGFESAPETGTRFWIRLPLSLPARFQSSLGK